MFLLSTHYYEEVSFVGVFNTAEKAKKYVAKIRNEDVSWTGPDNKGGFWGDRRSGYYKISTVELNPRQP